MSTLSGGQYLTTAMLAATELQYVLRSFARDICHQFCNVLRLQIQFRPIHKNKNSQFARSEYLSILALFPVRSRAV